MSVPSRSDTALRSTYQYNVAGRQELITDSLGVDSYFEFDAQGRKTKEVLNYDAGVNSGAPSGTDDNQTVENEYTDGFMTKLTAVMAGVGTQDTIYTYGTTKGASLGDSKISTGKLLKTIQYPGFRGRIGCRHLRLQRPGRADICRGSIRQCDQTHNRHGW